MLVNDDYQIKPNSIAAKAMPIKEFQMLVHQAYMALPDDFQIIQDNTIDQYLSLLMNEDDLDVLPKHLHPFASKIPYDYCIDEGYLSPDPPHDNYYKGTTLTGFQLLPNEVPILGIYGGSDCGCQALFIIYPNAQGHLDIYVPVRGNAVNLINKAIIGDAYIDKIDDEDYLHKYGLSTDTLYIDGSAMVLELLQGMKVYP